MIAVIYHEGWTRLRCKMIDFPPVLLPVVAAPAGLALDAWKVSP